MLDQNVNLTYETERCVCIVSITKREKLALAL